MNILVFIVFLVVAIIGYAIYAYNRSKDIETTLRYILDLSQTSSLEKSCFLDEKKVEFEIRGYSLSYSLPDRYREKLVITADEGEIELVYDRCFGYSKVEWDDGDVCTLRNINKYLALKILERVRGAIPLEHKEKVVV